MRKPRKRFPLSLPAHIEQDCNAYDAFRSGAGVISEEFDLERLLDFSEHFHPNMAFRYWCVAATGVSCAV